MKKKLWLFEPLILMLFVLSTGLLLVSAFVDLRVFYGELPFYLVAMAVLVKKLKSIQKDSYAFLHAMGERLDAAQHNALTTFPIPVLVANNSGEIVWYNDLFRAKVLQNADVYGSFLQNVFPILVDEEGSEGEDPSQGDPWSGRDLEYEGKMYTVYCSVSETAGENMTVYYFVDNTALKLDALEYYETRPSVILMQIDNYDELLQNSKESEKAYILGQVEFLMEDFIGKTNGFLCKLDRDKFLAVAEERHIREIIAGRFDILDRVRGIPTGSRLQPTLSIGIGRGAHTLNESEQLAKQALDMALGRGGDQVAEKTKTGFEFYGGVSKGVEKRTKVKSRMVATALEELIDAAGETLIMGHKFADLDAVGAGIGLAAGIRTRGKNAYVVVDPEKNLVQPLLERMEESRNKDLFLSPKAALERVKDNTLLVIVDTHSPNYVESRELYEACKDVVVIDHHRLMVGHIDNSVIFYHEQFASSTSEMVAELLQYLNEERTIDSYAAEALLSGIMLDTKNFIMKTGARTFEAAAYLKKLGADTVEVKKLFSTSIETYQSKAHLVGSAEIYRGCAIACAQSQGAQMRLAAPQAADELLGISGVIASFVLYETDGVVNFSARSMGALNVQVIMEKLGGGGHQTMAGAQMHFPIPETEEEREAQKGRTALELAKEQLLVAIDGYYQGR